MKIKFRDAIEELSDIRPDLAEPVLTEVDRARRQAARYRVQLRAAEDHVTHLRQLLNERGAA